LIKVEKITKSFGDLQVLKGINLEVPEGKLYSIVGPSGAGKTTLLQIIGTLSQPVTGNVFINGQNISVMNERQLADFRNRQIGFVFQFHYLLPDFSAIENVMFPALIQGMDAAQARSEGERLLESVGLKDRMSHRPGKLSGGEQQRVAVARAVILQPSLVLADEPTGSLDLHIGEEVQELLFQLNQEKKIALVVATHNREFADRIGRRVELRDGLLMAG